ncbi:MAG: MATE family efflux transporter [Anaerolineae bacterium]|jgi:putative MATE family efflux protein|nr:MATE family efflux transporter [Anaerolineae bacterium]
MLKGMFRDREFISGIVKIGVPVALQQLLYAAFGLLDTFMMGQMGEQAIAAVALANQITFVCNLTTFGIVNAASIFAAQYWGVKEIKGIHKVVKLTLILATVIGLVFVAIAAFFPEAALRFYTDDAEVIRLGAQYLRLIAFTYLTGGIYFVYVTIMRSTRQVMLPTAISVIALGLNVLLNYTFIFGKFGAPQMGVSGAGLGTLIVRILQLIVLLVIIYWKKIPAAAPLRNFGEIKGAFMTTYFKTAAPVLLNEVLWSLAITTINSVYAHISTEAAAAVNISATVEQIIFVVGIGMANAAATLVGNAIGAGEEHKARMYGLRSLVMSISITILVGVMIFAFTPWIVSLYNITDNTRYLARRTIQIMSLMMWNRATMVMWVVGILRPGGDTRFTMLVDSVLVWLVGVPAALLGANVLGLPIYWVYFMVMSEELVKNVLCFFRFRSGKWINNLTHTAEEPLGELV